MGVITEVYCLTFAAWREGDRIVCCPRCYGIFATRQQTGHRYYIVLLCPMHASCLIRLNSRKKPRLEIEDLFGALFYFTKTWASLWICKIITFLGWVSLFFCLAVVCICGTWIRYHCACALNKALMICKVQIFVTVNSAYKVIYGNSWWDKEIPTLRDTNAFLWREYVEKYIYCKWLCFFVDVKAHWT